MGYEIRVLGPVTLLIDSRTVTIGPAKRRAMLAALALDANRPVSLTRLSAVLWGETPPASAVANLRTHAAALRRTLGGRLLARPSAYELRLEDGELDATEFARLAVAGRGALRAGEAPAAVSRLASALGLWRGGAAECLPRGGALDPRLISLDEQRLEVFEDHVQARLDVNGDPDVVVDLRRHLAQHPLRERAWQQLMLALYRTGNVAAALTAYTEARTALTELLGIDPGPDLTALQQAILARDPGLVLARVAKVPPTPVLGPVAPATTTLVAGIPVPVDTGPAGTVSFTAGEVPEPTPAPPVGRAVVIPRQLPADLPAFVGRGTELAALTAALLAAVRGAGPPAVAICGRGGIGKSALAVRVAHLLAGEFPDGQVVVHLRGSDPYEPRRDPDGSVRQVLRALGEPAERPGETADERAARYRSAVAGRRLLVLADDVAAAAQVRALVPGATGGALLVTSRRSLTALDAVRVEPGPLDAGDSVRLLAEYAGAARAAEDPCGAQRLVMLCAGLPLALRIAGARLAGRPAWPLGTLAAELADDPLGALEVEDMSLRDRLAPDYLATAGENPLAARLFRLSGVLPEARITAQAAAAQLDVPAPAAHRALEHLVDNRLADSPRPGLYRVPRLLRAYAAELAAEDDPRLRGRIRSECTA